MSIKQRTGIPGGACEFDLPSYHFWLHRPAEERIGQLAAWTGRALESLAPAIPRTSGARIDRSRRSLAAIDQDSPFSILVNQILEIPNPRILRIGVRLDF